MSSRKKRPSRSRLSKASGVKHTAFFPLLILSFIFWLVYRGVFQFPVLFDELVGKAIFFGLPVWLYILVSGFKQIAETFAPSKIKRGLMLGLAVGGLFGFAATLAIALQRGNVLPVFIFGTDRFWWEFLLALITSFWETLFFFSFVMLVVQSALRRWARWRQIMFVTLVFVLFHAPNIFLRFQGGLAWYQLMLLALFALGQALFFAAEKNGYSLVLSQTLWGMVLLLHF